MDERLGQSADALRRRLEGGALPPWRFRSALLEVPPEDRDAWIDRVLGLEGPLEDGPDLPRGCVPYLPTAVQTLLNLVDHAQLSESDVFVDVGSGPGRAAIIVHLLTGAAVTGIEIQSELISVAQTLQRRMKLTRVTWVQGDAVEQTHPFDLGSVFFLYCPFSGQRLTQLLGTLQGVAQRRNFRLGCVNLPLPALSWLSLEACVGEDLCLYSASGPTSPFDNLRPS